MAMYLKIDNANDAAQLQVALSVLTDWAKHSQSSCKLSSVSATV